MEPVSPEGCVCGVQEALREAIMRADSGGTPPSAGRGAGSNRPLLEEREVRTRGSERKIHIIQSLARGQWPKDICI